MLDPKFARYIGLPFTPTGDSLDGINCWNLHCLILKECCGVELPTYRSLYKDAKDARGIKDAVAHAEQSGCWKRNVSAPKIYDLVLLRVRGFPWHIGTYIGDRTMINANEGACSCLERVDGMKWANNVLGYWRHEKQ
jgi:cell wall-associated NlpC family hydrolase